MNFSDLHINFDKPFVIYKHPGSSKLQIISQNTNKLFADNNLQTNGFYFAPFHFDKDKVVVFPTEQSNEQSYLIREFKQKKFDVKITNQTDDKAKNIHINKVEKAIKIIQSGELNKIIVSRKQDIKVSNLPLFQVLLKLMNLHEHSFVYLWHHPKIGTWLGATPELLASFNGNTIKTMALAGTIKVENKQPVQWQIKEIKEQQIVTDYISELLKKYTTELEVSYPKTIFQGNIAHIQTELKAKVDDKIFKKLIKKLHPTPAVCGMPTDTAKMYIAEIEQYNRKYYTGFLGKLTDLKTVFYVNLRCMEIFPEAIQIYVGGGIVMDSIPENEWQETINKSTVLLSIF